jgi:hypothetical protein
MASKIGAVGFSVSLVVLSGFLGAPARSPQVLLVIGAILALALCRARDAREKPCPRKP